MKAKAAANAAARFLSTPSARRATCAYRDMRYLEKPFLSTPSARRATDLSSRQIEANVFLSTPSARRATEGDILNPQRFDISIHALREEGDFAVIVVSDLRDKFLSTPSARRAT